MKEKITKTELLEKSANLQIERKEIFAEIRNLKKEHKELSAELQPQIDILKTQADSLAGTFRDLFQQSQKAYAGKDGASAKSLSVEGHAVKDRCQELNDEVATLINQLKGTQDQINSLYKKTTGMKIKAENCIKEANAIRETQVNGFEKSGIVTEMEIEELLDEFPRRILREVKRIEYDENLFWESKIRKIKVESRGTAVEDRDGKILIKIGKQPGKTPEEKTEKLTEAVGHEIGYAVYIKFLTDEQRADWFVLHTEDLERGKFISDEAILDDGDDFAESFRFFKSNSNKLQNHDERRYNLIEQLMEELDYEDT